MTCLLNNAVLYAIITVLFPFAGMAAFNLWAYRR